LHIAKRVGIEITNGNAHTGKSKSINQSVFISGKMPIETNNKQTDRQRDT